MARQAGLVSVFGALLVASGCATPVASATTDGVTTYKDLAVVTAVWFLVGLATAGTGASVAFGRHGPPPERRNSKRKRTSETEPSSQADTSESPQPPDLTTVLLVRAFGLVLIVVGAWLAGNQGTKSYRENIRVSDTAVKKEGGLWQTDVIYEFSYAEVLSIEMRPEVRVNGRRRSTEWFADIRRKKGGMDTIRVDNLLSRAWPDIATRATKSGVRINDNGFNE